jgi:acetylornithine deacetylase/succinyl-diaminopimelate desuccinylase-like protein
MGSMVFTITLESKRGGMHTTYVPFEENPIRHLGDLIQRINVFQQELNMGTVHALAGPERIDLGIVQAGDYFNRTPLRCTLTGTRRWCPGRNAAEILAELEAQAAPFAQAGDLRLSVGMVQEREPFETPGDDPAVKTVMEAHQIVTSQPAKLVGKRIVGDANLYVNLGGIPSFYYGPANETSHSNNEWVSISQIEQAAKVYALAAAKYCGVSG